MGWQLPPDNTGRRRVDMKRVDGWCVSFSYLKKKLDNYTYEELPKLVSQFELVYTDYLNKI